MYETTKKEKALLVMVEMGQERWPAGVLAEEFKNLVLSTGLEVSDLIHVKRKEPTPSLYIGKGKAEELAVMVQEQNVDVVIFNENLRFTQQRNLEDTLGVKTIDRTQLILDIFAAHADTQEGILQVELAQLEYLLPRLKGKGIMLSRLGGGIGTRGPGEKKLEVDRRRISDRVTRLREDLEEVRGNRELMRKKRQKESVRICSLVGYTNAGKSTLFNALTESHEKTSPSLFTTLDTISHTFMVHNLKCILTDTVGFIYKLPPYLIEAFKATLEELQYADVLLHIIDANSFDIHRLLKSVNVILEELKLAPKSILLVFNKIDLLTDEELANLMKDFPQAVFVSALRGLNIETLKERIYELIFEDMVEVVVKIPFKRMEVVNYIHSHCEVLKKNYSHNEAVYWVKAKRDTLPYLARRGIEVRGV